MNTEDFIRELAAIEEQYKNRIAPTFEVNISSMARDCRKHIEYLSERITTLKDQNTLFSTELIACNERCKDLEKENEKMKCCGNCKHEYTHGVCVSPAKCEDMDKWELAE